MFNNLLFIKLKTQLANKFLIFLIILSFLLFNEIYYLFSENFKEKIKVGIYNNEPKIFLDLRGKPAGIWVDLINEIAKINNWDVEFIFGDWQKCLDNLQNEVIDLMPDVAYSDERAELYSFNKVPVLYSVSKIYSNNKINLKNLSDLNGKKIAVLSSSIQEKNLILLKENLLFNYEIVKVNSLKDGFILTYQGLTDCVIVNNFFGNYFFREYNLRASNIELFPVELFFITKKGKNLQYLDSIDIVLEKLKKDKNSTYYRILKKWEVSYKSKVEILLKYITIFSIVFFSILIFFFFLMRRNIVRMKNKMENDYKRFHNRERFLIESLNKKVDELDFLYKLSTIINFYLLDSNFFSNVLTMIIEYLKINGAIIFLTENENLIVKEIQPEDLKLKWNPKHIHNIGECVCGNVLKEKKSLFIRNLKYEKLVTRDECIDAGFESIAVIPLMYLSNLTGILLLASFTEKNFFENKNLIETIASNLAVSLNNLILHSKILLHSKELEHIVNERTKELEEALEKAQFADKMKSTFLATMSHELRTPLNSIIGFTGILLQELPGKLNDEQKKQLTMVKKSSQHLLDLINDVLDLSKIEAGEFKLVYEKFELLPFLEDIFNSLMPQIQKKGLGFDFFIDESLIFVNTDKRRLKQIIINLLSNAIKFTNVGKISFTCKKNDKNLVFSIADTGIGIKDEDKVYLFKPFLQVDQGLSRNYEGTGLGLSVCKKLVELLGGKICFESEFGKGSTFIFTIPYEDI
ncbi:MAG: ATP-binding protein [Spirochaetes bacterium]|nr:ATP-binding protein [Spirochaetota bacterium]